MTDNIAVLQGYTKEVGAYGAGVAALSLLIKPKTDLDTQFKAWCMDNQEFIIVQGYNLCFDDVKEA